MITLKNYQLGELLGKGGQSDVYHATDPQGREVANKILRQGERVDLAELARFEREIKIAEQTKHPGVVQVFDVIREDNRFCIVMELLRGESLHGYLERHGHLPFHEFK